MIDRQPPFHIPDRVFFLVAALIVVLTWAFLLVVYRWLPAQVVTHYDLTGAPNGYAPRSWWLTFLLPVTQVVFLLVVGWLYRVPQKGNDSGLKDRRALSESQRRFLFTLERHFLAVLAQIVELLFAYLVVGGAAIDLGTAERLNVTMLSFLLMVLIVAVVVYTVWMRKVRRGVATIQE